jgi:general secretion pathway protein G
MSNQLRRLPRQSARAFTLLEVMIVIVIILAIAGLVTVNLMGTRAKATAGKVEIQLKSLRDALSQFNLDFNRYPTDDEGITVLWDKSKLSEEGDQAKWRAYVETPIPTDDWGSPWVYRQAGEKAPEGKFDLLSNGPDKEEGTEDDINVWPKSALEGVEGAGGSTTDAPPPPPPSGG